MTQYKETYPAIESMKPRVSELRRVTKVMFQRQVVIAGIVITLAAIIVAIIAPWISPADPIKQDLDSMRQPPSSEHLLGTDEYGRDVMSRLIYGTRISIKNPDTSHFKNVLAFFIDISSYHTVNLIIFK